MSNSGKIAYFYDSTLAFGITLRCIGEMGNYYYAPNHPMKPQRLRLTHNLLLAYKLYRYLEVFVGFVVWALTVETSQSHQGRDGEVPYQGIHRFSTQD